MHVKLHDLSLSNFMPFGKKPTEVNLDSLGRVRVRGINKDIGSEGYSANGVGKTTIFQAICFALFGKGLDKIKADEFVNLTNGKKLVVSLTFSVDGTQYKVIRCRKPSSLTFLRHPGEDREENLSLDSMGNTDKAIVSALGMSYDVFTGVYFMSPHRDAFLGMSGPDQRKFIEDVLNLDLLADRAEALRKIVKDEIKVDTRLKERDLQSARGVNERVDANITRLNGLHAKHELDKTRRSESLKETIELCESVDFEAGKLALKNLPSPDAVINERDNRVRELELTRQTLTSSITSNERDLRTFTKALAGKSEFDLTHAPTLDRLRSELAEQPSLAQIEDAIAQQAKRVELEDERRALESELQRVTRMDEASDKEAARIDEQLSLLTAGECPTCGSKTHTEQMQAAQDRLLDELEKCAEELQAYGEKIDELKASLANITANLDQLPEITITNPERAKNTRERLESEIQMREGQTNPYADQVEELVAAHGSTDAISETIDELKLDLKKVDEQIGSIRGEYGEKLEQVSDELDEIESTYGTIDLSELINLEKDYKDSVEELKELEASVNPYDVEIEQASSQYIDIDAEEQALADLVKREEHAQYLIKLLTDSKSFVRKNIVDQYVPYLNKRINEGAAELGLGHVCEIKSDLTVDLLYMNKPVSFFLTSRGERLRLNMATMMAFRELMEMMGRSCNVLMIDEMFDSALDGSGTQDAIRFVAKSADNVLLVSHRDDFGNHMDRTLSITKQNGFATLEFQPT